jgi:hypothetical protein
MSEWHAIGALEEALNRTVKLLFHPVKAGFWLKLALVVLLANGLGGGGNSGNVGDSSGGGGSLDAGIIIIIAVVIAVVIFIGLVLTYISSVYRFVLVKSLVKEDVKLVGDFKEQAGNGLKLFFLQIAVIVFFIVFFGGGALIIFLLAKNRNIHLVAILVLGVIGFIALIVLMFASAILMWLVTEFTVPIMYATGCSLVDGLKRVRDLIRHHFWQFAVYVLLKFALGLAATILLFVLSLIVFLIVFSIALILGVGAYLGLSALGGLTAGPGVIVLAVLAVVAYIAVVIVFSYLIMVATLPLHVFLRYYGLIFLQRIDPALDLFKLGEKNNEASAGEDAIKVY